MAERIPNATAKTVVFRAFLASDSVTPATGKTIAVTISKNGATSFSNPNAGATNATEMASGFYKFDLDTTDTGTNGPLSYRGAEGTINDVGDVFEVVAANITANVVMISGDATAADNLEAAFDDTAGPVPSQGVVDQGTAQSATGTTVVLRSAAAFADNTLIDAVIQVLGSTQGYWQTRVITANTLSDDTVTVAAWAVTPTGTITYRIYGAAAGATLGAIADAVWEEALADHEGTVGSVAEALATAGGSGASASDIADAVLDEALSGHTTAGTLGKAIADIESDATAILEDTGTTLQGELDGIQTDTEDIQARLPAALTAAGNIKADALYIAGLELDTTAGDKPIVGINP